MNLQRLKRPVPFGGPATPMLSSPVMPTAATSRGRAARSLLVTVDPAQPETLQHQIYSAIRRAILEGTIPPGTRLDSSRALAMELGISRTTTLLAYDQLTAEGYLEARHGSGTFVAREIPDDLARPRRHHAIPRGQHPPLSARGTALAAMPTAASRIPGPPRPFRIGVPALDAFPTQVWAQLVQRRVRSLTMSQLDYGDARGFPALREAIAEHVQAARGTRCTADAVIVVAGAQRGLDLIFRLLLDPGDPAWMEEPGYSGAHSALVGAGARIRAVPVDEEGLDVLAATRRAGDARLAYVTPSHQYPLGVTMSLRRRLALLQWAAGAGAWIVEDDYDSEFRYGSRPIPCLHGLDADGRVIYVGTFAKTLFPALRLGFLIVPPDLQEAVRAARRAGESHPPVLEQAALTDLLAGGHYERHLRRMRSIYRERMEALVDAAARYCTGALTVRPVSSGLHAVAELHEADDQRVFAEARELGVEVMPLSAYYLSRRARTSGLVLGFGSVRPEVVFEGMERLARAIERARRAKSAAGSPTPSM